MTKDWLVVEDEGSRRYGNMLVRNDLLLTAVVVIGLFCNSCLRPEIAAKNGNSSIVASKGICC